MIPLLDILHKLFDTNFFCKLHSIFLFKSSVLWIVDIGIGGGLYNRSEGIAFIGNDATLVLNRQGWAVFPEAETGKDGVVRYRVDKLPDQEKPANVDYLQLHVRNFSDSITNNTPEKLNCNLEKAAHVAITCCIGNIAQRLGRKVYWDAQSGRFHNDPEADLLMQANYENGWKLPSH